MITLISAILILMNLGFSQGIIESHMAATGKSAELIAGIEKYRTELSTNIEKKISAMKSVSNSNAEQVLKDRLKITMQLREFLESEHEKMFQQIHQYQVKSQDPPPLVDANLTEITIYSVAFDPVFRKVLDPQFEASAAKRIQLCADARQSITNMEFGATDKGTQLSSHRRLALNVVDTICGPSTERRRSRN